jgi:hypothetical protein
MLLLLFSIRCIQLEWELTEKTSCGGSPPKKVFSRSNPFVALWPLLKVAASPRKVWCTHTPSRAALFCVVSGSWQDSYPG